MKTTLDLPDNLVRELKLRALLQGQTVKSLVAEILGQGLGVSGRVTAEVLPVRSMVEVGTDGLPVIRTCAVAPASQMSVDELLNLEQESQLEEDLQRARITG